MVTSLIWSGVHSFTWHNRSAVWTESVRCYTVSGQMPNVNSGFYSEEWAHIRENSKISFTFQVKWAMWTPAQDSHTDLSVSFWDPLWIHTLIWAIHSETRCYVNTCSGFTHWSERFILRPAAMWTPALDSHTDTLMRSDWLRVTLSSLRLI